MTNITICCNGNCPMRNLCLRAVLSSNTVQSYYDFGYTCNIDTGFEDYIPFKSDEY